MKTYGWLLIAPLFVITSAHGGLVNPKERSSVRETCGTLLKRFAAQRPMAYVRDALDRDLFSVLGFAVDELEKHLASARRADHDYPKLAQAMFHLAEILRSLNGAGLEPLRHDVRAFVDRNPALMGQLLDLIRRVQEHATGVGEALRVSGDVTRSDHILRAGRTLLEQLDVCVGVGCITVDSYEAKPIEVGTVTPLRRVFSDLEVRWARWRDEPVRMTVVDPNVPWRSDIF